MPTCMYTDLNKFITETKHNVMRERVSTLFDELQRKGLKMT